MPTLQDKLLAACSNGDLSELQTLLDPSEDLGILNDTERWDQQQQKFLLRMFENACRNSHSNVAPTRRTQ